ncbi:Reverse transcriptase [Ceratobasidium sp. AG-Ba]|nr:Reverse transcriptase [Ceratobasidium sp. AG-Ba]
MMESDPRSQNETFSSFFDECLDAANSTIVMRFQDDWYAQTDGLAMGMHHAPDLANLYGSYYENDIIPTIPGLLYYGRYIDDVIFIIKAASAREAVEKAQALKIGVCRIAWEPAKDYGIFLDVRLWVEGGRIHHRPHRKTGNHLERIPWTSAHPQDVKRGTYLGELSRMATLCSTISWYNVACEELRELYIARGYPPNLIAIASWHNKNAQRFWDTRLQKREESPKIQVVRTWFNPVWESVDIHAVEKAVKDQWEKETSFNGVQLPDSILLPVKLSRARTNNLGNLATRLRKTVLNYSSKVDDTWIQELNPWYRFEDDNID